jgi:hypothetical protein
MRPLVLHDATVTDTSDKRRRPRVLTASGARDALMRRAVLAPLERMVLPPLNQLRAREGLHRLSDATHFFAGTAPLVLYHAAEPFEYPRRAWPRSVRLVGPGAWDSPADRLRGWTQSTARFCSSPARANSRTTASWRAWPFSSPTASTRWP